MMYECAICQSLNHASRTHCQYCGTIPAKYSIIGKPAKLIGYDDWSYARDTFSMFIPVAAAEGAVRAEQHHTTKAALKTVELDYYAENDD